MKTRWMLLALGAVSSSYVVVGCARAHGQGSRAEGREAREVELLVYSGDFGMVQETRSVTLEKGVSRVGLTDVSKALDQNSVMFNWPDRKDVQVRSSTYDLGMDESGALLKRFLGKEIELVYRNQNGREGDRVKGTLEVAEPGNVVVKADGRYIVNPDATIEAPTDAGIVTIPQLTAEVESGSAGSAKLGVSYLTGGLSWSADYTLTLGGARDEGQGSKARADEPYGSKQDLLAEDLRKAEVELRELLKKHAPEHDAVKAQRAKVALLKTELAKSTLDPRPSTLATLDCWASVMNKTGTDFPDAKLKFVAGSPNRAAYPTRELAAELKDSGIAAGTALRWSMQSRNTGRFPATSAPTIEAVGELHAYPYEANATIRQDQINRVRMMGVEGMSLKKWYAIGVPTLWRDGFQGNPDTRLTATLGINFKNDEASKLGKPMPGGAVRVYEPDANGRPQYIGAATIRDTPKDARVSLTLSNVFDVYAQSKLVKSEKIGKRKVRKTLEITVHNEKASAQEVRLVQNFYGTYTIVSESAKSAKLNAGQRQWALQVPAGGEVKLKVVAEF